MLPKAPGSDIWVSGFRSRGFHALELKFHQGPREMLSFRYLFASLAIITYVNYIAIMVIAV